MRARKRFGQHFLHDPAVLERLARVIGVRTADRIVEIGPGRGALTHKLLETPLGSLDAIEIDRDLAARLRTDLASQPRFRLHEADALEFDFAKLAHERGGRLRIVGNLPYNISTPLLFHLLQFPQALEDLHVMLQREVVARIAARPRTREYGRLTVMLAPWVRAERLFDIGPGAFQPPPQVWSAVVRLEIRPEPAFRISPQFSRVVAMAFAHRRKTLRNALQGLVSAAQIEACGLDPSARPETLDAAAFNELASRAADAALAPSPTPATMG
jgi:16S rRNA (adenine1518-N6/adenine1519-N6)-dimethyltransferase